MWLTGFKHPFQRGARNDYHELSRGWDLNRRPPERNPQTRELDHSATRPRHAHLISVLNVTISLRAVLMTLSLTLLLTLTWYHHPGLANPEFMPLTLA